MEYRNDKIQRDLELLGLSPDQAQIYLLLVAHKELRIGQIVSLAQMPRSSVYACLEKLYELGIAEEIIEDHHKKIKPYAISILRHDFDEKLTGLQRLTRNLQELEAAHSPTSKTPQLLKIRYYKNRAGARQLMWNTLKTKNTMCVFSEWGRSRYVGVKFYENFVTESHNRTIRERVLTNPTPRTLEIIRRDNIPLSTVARTKLDDVRAIPESQLPIKGETFIYNAIYAQVYLRNAEINGFEIESQHFAGSQSSMFEMLWDMARPITDFL